MRKKSKRSKKSNRVSWASGDDLCQVKLFSSEDCPAIVGLKSQDDLQTKSPGLAAHTVSVGPNDLPPGFFESGTSSNQSGVEPSYVSQIRWKCPSKFALSQTWQVASGEESEELNCQNSRELRVLEAVYPRFSAIPASPSVTSEVEKEHYNDTQTPVVPLIPIEEEESDVAEPVLTQPLIDPSPLQSRNDLPQCGPISQENPPVSAASASLAELLRTSNENGSLIDTDLLIKILSDKQMIQRLMVADGQSSSGTETRTIVNPRNTMPISVPGTSNPRPVIQDSTRTTVTSFPMHQEIRPAFSLIVRPPISIPGPEPFNNVSVRPPAFAVREPAQSMKDMNYYKNLIRQHGDGKGEAMDLVRSQNGPKDYYHHVEPKPLHNFNTGESKKHTKLCGFFNTQRGCLKGSSCPFLHEVPEQWRAGNVTESHNSTKRMKLSGEISGGMLV